MIPDPDHFGIHSYEFKTGEPYPSWYSINKNELDELLPGRSVVVTALDECCGAAEFACDENGVWSFEPNQLQWFAPAEQFVMMDGQVADVTEFLNAHLKVTDG